MRYLTAALAVFLLCYAPVSAQPSTPVPSVGTTAISEFKDASQTFGVLNVAMFALLVGGVILAVLAVKYVVLPLITANTQANQLITANQVQVTNALLEGVKAQQATAATNERSLQIMAQLETHEQAQQARGEVVKAVNHHTDEALRLQLEGIERLLTRALKGVNFVQSRNEQREGEEHITADQTLPQVQATLKEASERVKKLHDTGPLGQPSPPTNDKHKPED